MSQEATVGEAFKMIVSDIKSGMQIEGLKSAVDLEMQFENIEVKKGGFLWIKPNKSTRSTTIKLATRILPESI